MQSKPTNRSISMSTLADELQQSYGDYKRKKKSSFVKSVEKAYKLVSAEWSSNEEEEDDLLSKWERNYLNQKKGKSSDASESEKNTDESFSSDIETYIAYEEPNSLNNFMSNMYQYSTPVQTGRKNDVGGSQQQQQKPVSVNKTQQIFQRRQLPASSEVHSQTHKRIAAPDINEFSGNTPRKKQNRMKALSTTDPSVQKSDSNKEMLVDVGTSVKQFRKDGKMKSKESKNSHVQTSSVTFSDIGGNDTCLKEICKLLVHMKHPEVYVQLGVVPPRGILLHGPPGCGKTLLAHAIAGELQLPFIKIAATEIVSGVSGDSEQKVRELFDTAMALAPCIMFIDEIDAITPKRETASKDMERRIVAQLLACLDDLSSKSSQHVMVIGATNRPDSLDPALRRAGRFDREISLGIPDESSRKRILQVLCKNLRLTENFNFHHLARQTPGFVGADLGSLTREAAMIAVNRVFNELKESTVEEKISQENAPDSSPSTDLLSVLSWLRDQPPLTEDQLHNLHISLPDFEEALKHVQPSAKREGFATIPDVTWNDIGALHEIREELQLAILAPVKYPEKFKALGLCNPPGILLAGPPGCGKTLLAKAVANESGINFISVKGPELLNMYVGESERAVRQVFQRGRNSSPCVIFFDELDALCPRRSDAGESGSSARVVNQMLTEMDGLEDRKQVFIMAATNRPDIIDPAILRPGRLDKILYVGLPTAADRLDILNTITKHQTKPVMAEDISLKDASKDKRCEGFTGADLAALVREASINALKDSISNSSALAIQVNKEHLEAAFKKVKPSVSEKDQLKYEKMRLYHQIL